MSILNVNFNCKLFMSLQVMLHQRHVFALSITYSVLSSVQWQIYFFCFARILNRYWWNSQEVMNSRNRLNVYILGKTGTEIREQDTWENSPVLCNNIFQQPTNIFVHSLRLFAGHVNAVWKIYNRCTNAAAEAWYDHARL